MAGTKSGGYKAYAKNIAREPNFYQRIGAMGGKVKGKPKGFAARVECRCDWLYGMPHIKAECAGAKGGRISRRGPTEKEI